MNLPTTPTATLAALDKLRERIAKLEPLLERRAELVRHGRAQGVLPSLLAEASGLSAGRVSQLGGAPAAPEASEPAPATVLSAPERERGIAEVPSIGQWVGAAPVLSGMASTGARTVYGARWTVFVDLVSRRGIDMMGTLFVLEDDSPAALLRAVTSYGTHPAARVFVTGAAPQDASRAHDSRAAAVRAWGLAEPGEGWRVAGAGHYLQDVDSPVFRWTREDGHAVEILRAASWFGEGSYTPADAMQAWAALRDAIAARFAGGTLLSTPATTGRDLWRRTIPHGTSFPTLSAEVRELIAATAGQGRAELVRPNLDSRDELEGFTYLDGRLMYGALTWGMPVGSPEMVTCSGVSVMPSEQELRGRSRWLVQATVPADWSRPFGLLMAPREGGGWEYPAEPGRVFTTWADGAEAHLALSMGWHLKFREGMAWREGKPLNTWTERLREAFHELREAGHTLASRGVRAILLFAIGAFATRTHTSTIVVPVGHERELPANARVTVQGDQLVAQVPTAASAWTESMAHPEWSAAIWARARVRLLTGRGVGEQRTGALHVDPSTVLAFRTDALYLTSNPGWADDGQIGRFRVKGSLTGPLDVPTTEAALFALRDRAEGKNA